MRRARVPVVIVTLWLFFFFALLVPSPTLLAQGGEASSPGSSLAGITRLPLKQGAQGDEVRVLQIRLKALGFFQGPVTGFFGPLTAEAVRRFQKARGLPVVGYVGPRTLAALAKDPEPSAPAARPTPPSQVRQEPSRAKPSARRLPIPPPEEGAILSGGGDRLALTFNDGPDPEVLPVILEALASRRVQATFFVEGERADRHPDLVRQLIARGHEVENHGYRHMDTTNLSIAAKRLEIENGARAIRRITGSNTRFFRPPKGAYDADTVRAARAAGHRLMLWTNVGAPDVPFPGPVELVNRLTEAAFDGAVILLHADRPETAAALPALLDAWAAKGFRLVRLDELVLGAERGGGPAQAQR